MVLCRLRGGLWSLNDFRRFHCDVVCWSVRIVFVMGPDVTAGVAAVVVRMRALAGAFQKAPLRMTGADRVGVAWVPPAESGSMRNPQGGRPE